MTLQGETCHMIYFFKKVSIEALREDLDCCFKIRLCNCIMCLHHTACVFPPSECMETLLHSDYIAQKDP